MTSLQVTCQIHCQRPNWAMYNRIDWYRISHYRLYVNSDLLTERTWIWDNSTFLEENICVSLIKDFEYMLYLEPVVRIVEQAEFKLLNFKSINEPLDILEQTNYSVKFKIK